MTDPVKLEAGQDWVEWSGRGAPRRLAIVMDGAEVMVIRTTLVGIARLREKNPNLRGVPQMWAGPVNEEGCRLELWPAAVEGLSVRMER